MCGDGNDVAGRNRTWEISKVGRRRNRGRRRCGGSVGAVVVRRLPAY